MIRKKDILDLSINERIAIIGTIWDSIEKENIQLPHVHQEELDKRLDRFQRGEMQFCEWKDIKNELHEKR